MKKINLKIIESNNNDTLISISDGKNEVELTYSCLVAFIKAIEKYNEYNQKNNS
jgi:hypothetical protein